jgi:DNA-3-methyladenine glycosylase II
VGKLKLYSQAGVLQPVPPFDFSKSLDFLGIFAPMQDEQIISKGSLTKAISIDGRAIVFQIRSSGTVGDPQLSYRLFSDRPIDAHTKSVVVDRIVFFLSLDEDLLPFYASCESDPCIKPVIRLLYGYHQVKFLTPFENACWAVVSRRSPISVARKLKTNLIRGFGSCLEVDGLECWAFPEAKKVALADLSSVAEIGLDRRLAKSVKSIAGAFSDVEESFLRTADYDEVESWLLGINGIDNWTASFIMLRGLGRMESLDLDERSLFEAAFKVYG